MRFRVVISGHYETESPENYDLDPRQPPELLARQMIDIDRMQFKEDNLLALETILHYGNCDIEVTLVSI